MTGYKMEDLNKYFPKLASFLPIGRQGLKNYNFFHGTVLRNRSTEKFEINLGIATT